MSDAVGIAFVPQWLSIWRFLIIKIATIRLLMQMYQLLIIERVFKCFQCVGVDEIVLWLLRIVTSGLWMGIDVVSFRMFHWRALRIILSGDSWKRFVIKRRKRRKFVLSSTATRNAIRWVYLSIIIISGTCNRKPAFGFHCIRHLHRIRCERCGRWWLLTSEAKFDERYGEGDEQPAD